MKVQSTAVAERGLAATLTAGRPVTSWAAYREQGGGEAFARAAASAPEAIIAEIQQAGLRGRGGAGFPTATKWAGVRAVDAARRFVCCNGAEGEPGTFKDRYLLRHNPYQVIEGLAIAAQVIGAERAYLCTKAKFEPEVTALQRALTQLRQHTHIADDIELVLGPDEYLFGEEKALLAVIEGGLPLPRVLPPYIHGLFTGAFGGPSATLSNPTVVNNVETLAHVTQIVRHGADWFRSLGSEATPGTMVFTVSGDVQRPTVQELPLGLPLRSLIEDVAGGVRPGHWIKAIFPGLANALLTAEALDLPLDFDALKRVGSALGSGGFIVYDDSACMVKVAALFSHFLYVESCNQCTPCKVGSRRITERLDRLLTGHAREQDLDEITDTTSWVTGGTRCYLATSESVVIRSILAAFPEEFQEHLCGTCRLRHDLVVPKLVDFVEGEGFTYDRSYIRKQPNWAYLPA